MFIKNIFVLLYKSIDCVVENKKTTMMIVLILQTELTGGYEIFFF